ncbi:MAG: group III truncated hemoglobin [Bacteroidota bacterium]
MNDIQTEEDIKLWMQNFYDRLLLDPVTAPKFHHLDLPHHLPKIIEFWAFVLLEKEGYKTNVFEKHVKLELEQIHFEHWIKHFVTATDELFAGEKAEIAKQRARLLATTFFHKLKGEYIMF